ncbi:hypothetical protein [Marinomonas ostreistagni]|uniref:hypothetical protein n=1 Tax=Marinomonas ostreistagni TaxID=359209 RepID=UPI00195181D5|nr:hypothetical protein [Marinomonas ostreistagni]MBM6549907.1 hypothetical protein [Marinomonas ostreistagni]
MGDVVDMKQYLSAMPEEQELETALLKSLEGLEVSLSDAEKHEIFVYAKGFWSAVKDMESHSKCAFTLEIPCTEEEREHINDQVNDCVRSLVNPRTKLINDLVAELIVWKIREIQGRQG